MPYPINATFRDEKNKKENAPIMLYEIEVTPSNILYLAEYDQDVIYGGETYLKFPLTHEMVSMNIMGEIDAIKLKTSNVSREIGALLIANDGLRGKRVTLKLVFADQLSDASANITDTFYIDGSSINEGAAEFLLTSKLDIYDVELPGRMFERNYCQWTFKQEGCWLWSGSDWVAPSGFANGGVDCDKTRAGTVGCKYHVNGRRFGGFPAIPSRGFYVV